MKIQNENQDIVLEAQDVLDAFLEEDKVTSAEYKDGVFHIETVYGPVSFKLFGNAGDKEDA